MNEESFYTAAGGARGSVVTNPDDLPRFVMERYTYLQIEGSAVSNTASAGFFVGMARAGAQATVSLANTWTDIVNVVGAGFLGNVLASHGYHTGSKTVGIRVEIDGVLWEWLETITTVDQYGTLLLGSLSNAAAGGGGLFPEANRSIATADAAPLTSPRLATTSNLLSAGAPVLAFRESLKVSVRNNRVGATAAGQLAGCTYVMR
jgi:hypothetical protein